MLDRWITPYFTESDLFQKIDFISHAGIPMHYKIECDAINGREWDALAVMIMEYQKEPFGKVLGIPRGGIPLQKALEPYATGKDTDPLLVVDDVYSTGTSFVEFCGDDECLKWVVFARQPTENGVRALFTMPGK